MDHSDLAKFGTPLLNSFVDTSPKPRHRTGPPHNPGLRDLISGKRRFSSPPNRQAAMLGFKGWHERGYLPHRDEPGLTQFVTFRLCDAFPRSLRSEWAALLEIENDRERRKELEEYLDKGCGACHLRDRRIGGLVDESLRFHHGKRFEMLAWVVMPNHVHALFRVNSTPMSEIVRDWKQYTARQANRMLGRQGQFWADDCWDTYMRDCAHEARARRYIENNPTKALLVRDPKE